MTRHNKSRQLSAIRNYETKNFDYLAAVLLNEDYSIYRAAIVPRGKLHKVRQRFSSHVNGWLFHLDDAVWKILGVQDVTKNLKAAAKRL